MFKPHGWWEYEINQRVLIQRFYDSWNEEGIIDYAQKFQQVVAPLVASKQPWAILSLFDRWELGTPEIEPHVAKHCAWFIEHGVSHDCHVYPRSIIKQDQLDRMIPYTAPGYERRVFNTVDLAIHWLASNQFALDTGSRLLADFNG
jgi:hypothetical protein